MAYKSGSHSTVFSSKYYLVFTWQEESYSIENNTSTISWSLYIDARNGLMEGSATRTWAVTINGTPYSGTHSGITVNHNTLAIASGSNVVISHGSDGSKTFSFSYSFQVNVQFSSSYVGTVSGSSAGTLTTIPRATTPVFKNADGSSTISTVAIGTDFRIDVSGRASTDFSHQITYSFGGLNNNSSPQTVANNAENQYITWTGNGSGWSPSNASVGEQIPNASSGVCTVTCNTYNGTTLIGTKTATITLTVPSSWKPTVDSGSTTLTPSRNIFGTAQSPLFVNQIDAVVASVSATGSNGSTVRGVTISFQGATYNATYNSSTSKWEATTNVSTTAGASTVSIVATDSRGITSNASSSSITFLAYSLPENTLTVGRCDSLGNANETGDHMMVTVASKASSVKPDSTELNWRSVVVSYTIDGETNTVPVVTQSTTLDNDGEPVLAVTADPIAVANNKTCLVIATVSDKANSTIRSTNLSVGYCTIDFLDGGRGINFGGTSVNEGFVCNMDTTFAGKIRFGKNLFKPTIFGTSNSIRYEDNGDGGVIVNGTNGTTGTTRYKVVGTFTGKAGHKYILTGFGGDAACYAYISSTDTSIGTTVSDKTGAGALFTFNGTSAWNIRIGVKYKETITNQIIYIMIRDAGITDNTWEDYVPDVTELQTDYETKVAAIRTDIGTRANAAQFRVTGQTGTFNLLDYELGIDDQLCGVLLILLRKWTTVTSGVQAAYLVSFVNSSYIESTPILTSNVASLSFSGTTGTVSFTGDDDGGIVNIIGAPII